MTLTVRNEEVPHSTPMECQGSPLSRVSYSVISF